MAQRFRGRGLLEHVSMPGPVLCLKSLCPSAAPGRQGCQILDGPDGRRQGLQVMRALGQGCTALQGQGKACASPLCCWALSGSKGCKCRECLSKWARRRLRLWGFECMGVTMSLAISLSEDPGTALPCRRWAPGQVSSLLWVMHSSCPWASASVTWSNMCFLCCASFQGFLHPSLTCTRSCSSGPCKLRCLAIALPCIANLACCVSLQGS